MMLRLFRLFCMTDDREDKTLEKQENFIEIAKSKDVEVLSGRHQFLEFSGNILPITKSGDQLSLYFLPFQENRLAFMIKVSQTSSLSLHILFFIYHLFTYLFS